jgi:hypothetical protein
MTTRNFDDIVELLAHGRVVSADDAVNRAVVARGLGKLAPLHKQRNGVADAVLIELYARSVRDGLSGDQHAFVSSNTHDFSQPHGDQRIPHPDIADAFSSQTSSYCVGVDGLDILLRDFLGGEADEFFEELDFTEEPRRLGEITAAEDQLFDRVWYHRSLQHEIRMEREGDEDGIADLLRVAGPARQKVEALYTGEGDLGPYSDFELGMLNGKLSALRWVLGSEWDFLDT